ncbi:hypothetical protein HF086_016394 [Spodoptera exigua]|uniref:Uncharacterized protein n=1 Tax=Spodoptera exigua TaxID=7107 RepID=A0A922S7H8_SPOEX|nr:hypothetical protein HF086_016394 [Spodoptera exigua]
MLTASNFGVVIKRRENSSKAKLVKNILYKCNLSKVTAIAHGVENEQLAIKQLSIQENVTINPCGKRPEIVDSRHARGMPLREKESPKLDHQVENNPCRKRRLIFDGSPTLLSSSSDDEKENYLCRKRHLSFEGSSRILSGAFGANQENSKVNS